MSCQVVGELSQFDLERYGKEGVAVLSGYLTGDPLFESYLHELTWCTHALLRENGRECPPSLGGALLALHQANSKDVQSICHLNTLPNKLLSGGALKHGEKLLAVMRHIYGESAVLGSPAGSDTLHVFAADPLFDNYLLPIHQDYPYLLFSQHALTLWIPVIPYAPDVGGINAWVGSHRAGIRQTTHTERGHLQSIVTTEELEQYPKLTLSWDVGDVVIMDTHMLHQGIANRNPAHLRATQLFRYARLDEADTVKARWRSAAFARKAPVFEELHPQHYVKPVAYEPKKLFN